MVLRRVACGHPLFCGFWTQAARRWRGSLFIGILESLIQRRLLLVRKMRISGTFACLRISVFVIFCSSTSNMLMLRMARKLRWWNTWREHLMELVMVQDSQPQRTVLSAVAVYTVTFVSRSIFGCLKKDLRAPTCTVAFFILDLTSASSRRSGVMIEPR